MKVQIEKVPTAFNTSAKNYEFYALINCALTTNTVAEFMELFKARQEGVELDYFVYGSGSSHVWVHEKDWRGSGDIEPDRLLLITEE